MARAFDLLAVSLAFHRLDQQRFLSEARRALIPAGSLVFYDAFFEGPMWILRLREEE
jgi:SAM-dependent methyltransferase